MIFRRSQADKFEEWGPIFDALAEAYELLGQRKLYDEAREIHQIVKRLVEKSKETRKFSPDKPY